MRNFKERKKINAKLIFAIFWLLFLVVIIFFGAWSKKEKKDQNLDYKLGIVADDGVALVSISNERKMVNVLNLDDEVELWVPQGVAWQNNKQIKNVLEKDKKTDLAREMFWYNFGFPTDKILFLNSVNQWDEDSILIKNWGLVNWLKYRWDYGKMFLKKEKIQGKLADNDLFLDEVMVRDFSESRLNNEDLRLSIFNNTSESGLANFMAKRLEWTGFSVVSTDNNGEKIDKCLIIYGNKTDLNYGWKIINQIFDCEKQYNENLNENELELYFGDKLAAMIQYSSYFK